MNIARRIRLFANLFGIDVMRLREDPTRNWLGLRWTPFSAVIDVGANTGQFAQRASSVFREATFYCFEPLPDVFSQLQAWAQTQAPVPVKLFQLALSDVAGKAQMFRHVDHTPSSSLLPTTETSLHLFPFTAAQTPVEVDVTTLDEALRLEDLPGPPLLIKLDVQGLEDRVIAGGRNTFSKASAVILEISLDSLYEGQASFKTLLPLLESLGFDYAGNLEQVYAADGHVVFVDALFLRRARSHSSGRAAR